MVAEWEVNMLVENIKVPTGNICVIQGEKGLLEFVSVQDYGKQKNIKADFLGLKDEINGVPHGELLPLTEKWVITISTQYGCSMGCKFCDVPYVGKGINATNWDLANQIIAGLNLHPEITATKRLNIHFARMGEPTWNPEVLQIAKDLHGIVYDYINNSLIHPVVSTMMPKHNKDLIWFLNEWMDIKNNTYRGDAGLQLSINSTSDNERNEMFNNNSLSLEEISGIVKDLDFPKGRKLTLNFALAGYEINAEKLVKLFDPKKFICKLTPMHVTWSCKSNNILTSDGYDKFTPYQKVEQELKSVGFDVIIFVPSYEEDEGRITCGNAILSGSRPYGRGIIN
jgi:23S rRNA (adenine2503-C2)-methyltransferase